MNYDVNLWFAKDKENNIITIDEVDENNKEQYYCPLCGSELIPKATKSKYVTPHFAHIDASKCNSETMVHWWFKNKFLVPGDKFSVVSDKEIEYVCKEVLVEQSYDVRGKIYRPDVTVLTECGNTIYFEMDYSNKKKIKDYIDVWLELKNIVVEIDIKKLMSKDKIPTFKALFYDGKCFNVKKNDTYYNTIGRYKERLYNQVKTSNKLKEMIQKLDWFWEEVINYKKDKIDIEKLVDFVDYNEPEEKSLILEILSTKRCTPVYEDFINYKVNLFEKLGNDLISGKNYFSLEKLKIGRKYKNIKYNTIKINNIYLESCNLQFEINKYSKEAYIQKINESITEVMKVVPYYNRAKEICLLIEEKYKDISDGDGLSIKIAKNKYGEYLYKIYLDQWWYPSDFIYIYNDCIKYGDEVISVNLFDKDNELLIIKFISDAIYLEIQKYNLWVIEERRKQLERQKQRREYERKRQEELLQRIQQEREDFNLILNKIASILSNNKDKIITYQTDYSLDDKCNLLYFKDYRGMEFIVHGGKDHLHDINAIEKSYYFHGFKNNYSKYKLIKVDSFIRDDIYIIETNDSYEIHCYPPSVFYNYPKIFSNKMINLSFRNLSSNTNFLPRYNFINAIDKLNNVSSKITTLKESYLDNYLNTNKDKIHSSVLYVTDEKINEEIHKILYPIIYLSEKYSTEVLDIKLNIDFTVKDGKRKPWLIKEFIEKLEEFRIYNVNNTI